MPPTQGVPPTINAKPHGYNTRSSAQPHQPAVDPPAPPTPPTAEEVDADASAWALADASAPRMLTSLNAERLATPLSVAISICSLITTEKFAPRFQKLDKSYSNTVPGFAATLQSKHPELYSSLLAVPDMAGAAARTAFLTAMDNLDAVFGGSAGQTFLVATAVWALLSAKSTKSAYLSMVLQIYLWLEKDAICQLRAAVMNPTEWSDLLTSSSDWMLRDTQGSPGHKRLDPSANAGSMSTMHACMASWDELLTIIVSAISCTSSGPELRSLKAQIAPGAAEHVQLPNESAVEYVARMTKTFYTACAGLRALGKPELVPHEDDVLVDIVIQGARGAIMSTFDRIYKYDGFTDHDMSWSRFQEYFLKAGFQTDSQLLRTARRPTKVKRPTAETPPEVKQSHGTRKERGQGREVQQLPGTPRADQGRPLPAAITAMSFKDRKAAALANNGCVNCTEVGHISRGCPYQRADGTKWVMPLPRSGVAAPATASPAPSEAVAPPAGPPTTPPTTAPPPAVGRAGVVVSFASMGQSTTAPAVARPGVASSSGTHGESPDEARSPVPLAHGDSTQEVLPPLMPYSDEWYMPAQRLCTDVRSLNTAVVIDSTFTTPLHPRRWGTYTAADFSAALFSQSPPDDAGTLTQDDSFEGPYGAHPGESTPPVPTWCPRSGSMPTLPHLHAERHPLLFSSEPPIVSPRVATPKPATWLGLTMTAAHRCVMVLYWLVIALTTTLVSPLAGTARSTTTCPNSGTARSTMTCPNSGTARSTTTCLNSGTARSTTTCLNSGTARSTTTRSSSGTARSTTTPLMWLPFAWVFTAAMSFTGPTAASVAPQPVRIRRNLSDAFQSVRPRHTWPGAIGACLQWAVSGTVSRALSAIPRLRLRDRVTMAMALLVLLSWLAVPTAAMIPYGASRPEFPVRSSPTSRGMACSGPATSGNVGVFNAFLPSGHRVTVGPDTFCDVSMISPAQVDPAWPATKVNDPLWLNGIGGTTVCDTVVQVPLRLQWGAPTDTLLMYVGETPPGVDVILGRDMLNVLGGMLDCSADRFFVKAHKLDIPLDSIDDNMARVRAAPLTVMATSSGCSFAYCTVRNLGFTVDKWYAVDFDPLCRAVASTIVPHEALVHIEPHDVTQLPQWVNNLRIDLHLDTSPCQSFSRARRNPPGFRDLARTAPARSAAALHERLRKTNPNVHFLVENVQFHRALTADKATFENMWSSTFVPLNASDYGSPSSRPRQYLASFTDLSVLPCRPPLAPHLVLEDGHHPPGPIMPCVVTIADTHNPPCSLPPRSKTPIQVSVEVMERLQGWPAGITDIGPPMALSNAERQRMVGNALNASQLWSILRRYPTTPPAVARPGISVPPLPRTAAALERHLSSLSPIDLAAWVRARKGTYEPIPLTLEPIGGQLPPAKPRFNYSIPAGLRRSCDYAIDLEIAKGHMRALAPEDYDETMFVSPGFVQPKPGRFYEGTDIPMVRLLSDARYLNSAMKPPPAHHFDSCPTQHDMCLRVPASARYFRTYDIQDAFHSCKVAASSQKYVVVQFGQRLVQYLGGTQGIANMAVFWNAHFQDIMDRTLGLHWREWYTIYVDDVGVHGATPEEVMARSRIFEAVLKAYGKTLSPKNSDVPYETHMDLAGLHFDHRGVSLSEKAIESLHEALDVYKVQTQTDVLHVVGVIQYCSSAFSWPTGLPSAEFTSLVAALNAIGQAPRKEIKDRWAREFPPIHARLQAMLHNTPRAALDPSTLLDADHCLVQVTDASDTGVAVALFRVRRPDASTVTKADLEDPALRQLVAIRYRKLTDAQMRWLTFETELYAMVLGVKFFGSFITTATTNFPVSGPAKIAFWSDSTTALSQWSSLTLPADTTDYLSAKARRFYAWADEVSFTAHWPLFIKHIPGETNDLAHIMSHLGDQMRERADYFVSVGATAAWAPAIAFPGAHSYHPKDPTDPLSNYTLLHLPLSPDQVDTVAEAYLSDTSMVNKVPLSDIFRVVTNHPTAVSVPLLCKQSIRGWANTKFFAVVPPDARRAIIYTTSSATRTHACDSGDKVDGTRVLVPVIPRGAEVRITTNPPITDGATGTHYQDHDLRCDLMLHTHDNAQHPGLERSQANLKALAWWPLMLADVETHWNSCAYCLAARDTRAAVGDAVHAAERFRLVEIDHKILDADTASATGYAAILTMIDDVSKLTLFTPVETTSTVHAAHAIVTKWYPFFGIPMMFRSDRGAAFTSELMRMVSKAMGVHGWDLSAPSNPTHHSGVERRNRVMEHFLDVGISNGDITSPAALERYCAAATATCNLEYEFNGHTVFEYVTGAIPRTHNNVVIKPVIDDVSLRGLDKTFIDSLRTVLSIRVDAARLLRDDAAREATLRRSAANAKGRHTTFDLRPGDVVSYEGKPHVLLQHTRSTPYAPVRSEIQLADAASSAPFEVLYSALRPLATQRPQHLLSSDMDPPPSVGEFVFYNAPQDDALVHAGVVLEVDSVRCLVHQHRQAPRRNRQFTPLYLDADTHAYVPRITPTASMEAVVVTVNLSDIIAVGSISDTRQVDSKLFARLASLGVTAQR